MIDVKEKPRMVERALLVGIHFPGQNVEDTHQLVTELGELVETLGIKAIAREIVKLDKPRPRLLVGEGKAQSILDKARELECDCLVFDEELSPAQQRNWEELGKLCVVDRQEIILDIFGERARTREAVLQVSLARMEYNLPRLKRAWTHLSRQRGGGTNMRGQGETQLEADQRLVRDRIARVKRQLEEVIRTRETQRKKRSRVPMPIAAIVGYTNAGKSSLLNALTGSTVQAKDMLFATLDPTTRQCALPNGKIILLTDTVGFVRKLPHRLVESFKATLEESVLSDILVHVVDMSHPEAHAFHRTTLEVLKELGAEEKRMITVFNKIDLCPDPESQRLFLSQQFPKAHFVSAVTGEGLEKLKQELEAFTREAENTVYYFIPYASYRMVTRLEELSAIRHRHQGEEGVWLECGMVDRDRPDWKPYEIEPPEWDQLPSSHAAPE